MSATGQPPAAADPAQTAPQAEAVLPGVPEFGNVAGSLRGWPVARLQLGDLPVVLTKTELAEVENALRDQGTAAADPGKPLCYVIIAREADTLVWLEAHPARTEQPPRVGIVTVDRQPAVDRIPTSCPRLAFDRRPASFDAWLWVGTPSRVLTRRLGRPQARNGDWWLYRYHGTAWRTVREARVERKIPYTSTALLAVRIEDGVVTALRASVLGDR